MSGGGGPLSSVNETRPSCEQSVETESRSHEMKRKMIVLNSLRLVIFLVHSLTSRTVYSQQEEHVASQDLSAVYLKWEFEKDSTMSQTADIHNSSKIYENCDAFIYEFAKQASRFIDCSIVNARPFRFCEGCVEHYEKAKTVYNDIKLVGLYTSIE